MPVLLLKRAANKVLSGWLQDKARKAVNQFAKSLIPVYGACELLITMSAPKRAFRTLSTFFPARVDAFSWDQVWTAFVGQSVARVHSWIPCTHPIFVISTI
uniref:Uncharacterized protein n=1 Tax=Eutreptiella gymnastica TaxID=73025 RepID=A0A7S1IBS9_9EUGL|mmetsp:Transcript_145610/g.254184  ORF Transcript_145610/g.254184 Transcript_145610/m.254184 type:complete len:101 (+) Transcript_145610:166-468(+)